MLFKSLCKHSSESSGFINHEKFITGLEIPGATEQPPWLNVVVSWYTKSFDAQPALFDKVPFSRTQLYCAKQFKIDKNPNISSIENSKFLFAFAKTLVQKHCLHS